MFGALCSGWMIALTLCALYAVINVIGMLIHFGPGMARVNVLSNLYAFFMSMPALAAFIFVFSVEGMISLPHFTLFAAAYLVWQMVYLTTQQNVHAFLLIVPLSLVNMVAWCTGVATTVFWLATTLA